ncbi:MAG: hypothetical protein ABEJ23_00680 [Haloarculaceae archaeon]
MIPAQVDLTGGGPLALLVTFLVATVFYALTLHLAALYVVGDVPHQRAVMAALVPTVVSLLLQRYGPLVVVPVTFLGDLIAISFVYRLKLRSALLLAVFHFTIAVILGLALANLFGLY